MLKFSRYAVVSVLFFMTLIIFLTFNPDSYDVTPVDDRAVVLRQEASVSTVGAQDAPFATEDPYDVALVANGGVKAAVLEHAHLALTLLKQSYRVHESVAEVGAPTTIIMAATIVTDEDIKLLKGHLVRGGSVIFAILPEMTEAVRALLEVTAFAPTRYVRGFEVYDGVLIGGMFRAENITLRCADVALSGRCKVLANGLDLRRNSRDAAFVGIKTPMIWRTYYESGMIFAFNAPFMEDASGMGLLTGILALANEDFLYPVVGTKSVALDHFPYIGDDAPASGRSSLAFTRDIVWPGMLSIARSMGITLTCYASGGFQEDEVALESWSFVGWELQKIRGELGYSVKDSTTLEEDIAFLSGRLPSLALRSFRAPNVEGLALYGATSVLTDGWHGAMDWLNDRAILLPMLSGGTGNERADFQRQCMLTLMGMVTHTVDMAPLYRGETLWNEFSTELAAYFAQALKGLDYLRPVTMSLTAEKAKNYLNTSLSVKREAGRIAAAITGNVSEVSLILRTDKAVDIKRCEQCTVTKLSDGVYWVVAPGPEFVIPYQVVAEAAP